MGRCLIDADYRTVNDQPVIRLFYVKDGVTSTEEIEGFKPYFYAIPKELKGLESEIQGIEGYLSHEVVEKKVDDETLEVVKITFTHPKYIRPYGPLE